MLAYAVHDVRIHREKQEFPPQDGWACWGLAGAARIECSCGHTDGPMANALAPLMARLHIHGVA